MNENLEFKKLKTDWEQNRATILNYTIGLITVWAFGIGHIINLSSINYFECA